MASRGKEGGWKERKESVGRGEMEREREDRGGERERGKGRKKDRKHSAKKSADVLLESKCLRAASMPGFFRTWRARQERRAARQNNRLRDDAEVDARVPGH